MSRLRMAASAACCFFALFSSQAIASGGPQCWQPYEVEAAKVRDLHIMLMLGALKCKALNSGISDKYSAFVEKKSGLLSSYNNVLKTRFMRLNGIADGQRAYEEFNTKLGNSHSGVAQAGSYCEITESLLTLATDARDRELPQLARNFSESALGIEDVCEAAPAPVTAEATVPAAADAAAATETATVAVAKAVDPPTSPASPQSAAEALEAAAAALQTAAASLKAQPAPAADEPAETPPAAKPAVAQPVSTAASAPAG